MAQAMPEITTHRFTFVGAGKPRAQGRMECGQVGRTVPSGPSWELLLLPPRPPRGGSWVSQHPRQSFLKVPLAPGLPKAKL